MSRGPKRQFLVRDVESGKISTVNAFSARGALARYLVGRTVDKGSFFDVKARYEAEIDGDVDDLEWEQFVTS